MEKGLVGFYMFYFILLYISFYNGYDAVVFRKKIHDFFFSKKILENCKYDV